MRDQSSDGAVFSERGLLTTIWLGLVTFDFAISKIQTAQRLDVRWTFRAIIDSRTCRAPAKH